MQKEWPFIIGVLALCAGPALAQSDSAAPPPAVSAAQGCTLMQPVSEGPCAPGKWWASGETMLWSVKATPLPPTLTTFAPGSPSATTGSGGALGVSGTSVVSPQQLSYGRFGSGRITLGTWLDPAKKFGLEATGFFLGSRTANFSSASGGSPPLRIPFNNVPPGAGFPLGSSSFVLADPAFAKGGQFITSTLHLRGAEGYGLYRALDRETLKVSFLAGFRFIDLREDLAITSTETLIGSGANFVGVDSFTTLNRFYGVEAGVKVQKQAGRLDGLLQAKVAVGDNRQTIAVGGVSTTAGFGTLPIAPGGVFTQSTNMGEQTRNQFCVVPEVQVQVGYKLTSRIRAFVGYDVLYMSNALRPGNQIDRTINFTGSAAISPGTTLTGAARPQTQFNGSRFLAQGVSLGVGLEF